MKSETGYCSIACSISYLRLRFLSLVLGRVRRRTCTLQRIFRPAYPKSLQVKRAFLPASVLSVRKPQLETSLCPPSLVRLLCLRLCRGLKKCCKLVRRVRGLLCRRHTLSPARPARSCPRCLT